MEQARQELVQMKCQGMERETRTCLWVVVEDEEGEGEEG